MRLEFEAFREHGAQSTRATIDNIEVIADAAVEVVVVVVAVFGGDVGGFGAVRGARDGDVRGHTPSA
ncbi:MAG: hypothetical protein QMB94_03565 [Phycisphaerales bacterium]